MVMSCGDIITDAGQHHNDTTTWTWDGPPILTPFSDFQIRAFFGTRLNSLLIYNVVHFTAPGRFRHQELLPWVNRLNHSFERNFLICKGMFVLHQTKPILLGSGYLQSGSAHRRRTLAYLQSRDEPIKALGSSHMTK